MSTSTARKRSGGKPASRNTLSRARAQPGVLLACLSTQALPAINPGARKRTTCHSGKFQGINTSTTPSGLCVTKCPLTLDAATARAERSVGCGYLRGQHRLGVLGVVVAGEGAFLHLLARFLERLAHLLRHERGKFVFAATEHPGGVVHEPGALRKGGLFPRAERPVDGIDDPVGLLTRHGRVGADGLAGGGINDGERGHHERSEHRRDRAT